jgi:hypothetical protein
MDAIRQTLAERISELETERDTQEALKDAVRIELAAANAKIAELRGVLKWVGEVYPSMNRESDGAVVHMTWEEWNAMRLALGLKAQLAARDTRKRRGMEGSA